MVDVEKMIVGETLSVPIGAINKRGNPMKGLRVFNEKCGEYRAQVEHTENDMACLRIEECLRAPDTDMTRDGHRLKLMFVPQKNTPRFRNCVDSCTQLGVNEFVLVSSSKAGSGGNALSIDDNATKRWITGSVEQSERMSQPLINSGGQIRDAIDTIRDGVVDSDGRIKSYFVAVEPRYTRYDDRRTLSLLEALAARSSGERRDDFLVVGPEGGWAPQELDEMLALTETAKVNIIPVTLGGGVMRSETAAIVGSGIFNCFMRAN
jgi:RsmE family RNA methyltransferase